MTSSDFIFDLLKEHFPALAEIKGVTNVTITLKSRTPARAAIDAWLYGPKGLIIDEERKPIQMTKTYELVEVSNECKE